mmetsp:Transcript_22998/g.62430  ORF Transcript_22998/g.62430 Transcript_22998/m.62430 type:complete len:224 (-) Transcript_22998:1356-2027(-)
MARDGWADAWSSRASCSAEARARPRSARAGGLGASLPVQRPRSLLDSHHSHGPSPRVARGTQARARRSPWAMRTRVYPPRPPSRPRAPNPPRTLPRLLRTPRLRPHQHHRRPSLRRSRWQERPPQAPQARAALSTCRRARSDPPRLGGGHFAPARCPPCPPPRPRRSAAGRGSGEGLASLQSPRDGRPRSSPDSTPPSPWGRGGARATPRSARCSRPARLSPA